MAAEIRTGRGPYRLIEAAAPVSDTGAIVLTLRLERADGIERVVFRCRIDAGLASTDAQQDVDNLIGRLQPWIEREFEIIREAALKSIRSERKLHQIVFDSSNRGPF